jgi:hypothetical protein
MKHTKFAFFALSLLAFFALNIITGCKKDQATEQENITKIVVHLTGIGNSFDQEFEWEDRDGDGGTAPVIDTIAIPANTQFNVHLHVYDESKSPVVDVSDEIEAENTAHLFVFKSTTAGLTISDLNTDNNGKPFGLDSKWTTTGAGNGAVQISLHHEPTDKTAAEPGGEIDFDVTFPVKVK